MTGESILERFSHNEPEETAYQSNGEYKAFGISRHAISLNCISRDGSQTGIAWSLYSDASYDPADGVVVEFSHKTITIKGSDLLSLYHAIIGNRVTFIAEADRATEKLGIQDGEAIVSIITIQDRRDH